LDVARSQVDNVAQIIDVIMDGGMLDAVAAMVRFLRLVAAEQDIAKVTVMVDSSLWFFFSSRRRHTRCYRDWSSDVCSSDLKPPKLAEQGWLGLVYPEEFGGVGLGFVDLTVLMEEMGRVVMPGPFLATLLGGLAILEAGSAEQKKQWLPRLADGKAKAALAWTEPSARWDAAGVATTAKPTADGWLRSGP